MSLGRPHSRTWACARPFGQVSFDHGNAFNPSLAMDTEEHRRVKGMRNGPKTEKMGQSTKSTRPGSPHKAKPHDRVNLADSSMA
ncbi:hypothetical protein F383_37621 [Gossypium arboreum]|uniref:Uncharacterized protein n=1 Tax=Gossypium arboreum TaxID=29729 RepID=A0A0B0MD63_GOSAR|nr:hypothetical protein F383_37621 [Gossypium arboreum]